MQVQSLGDLSVWLSQGILPGYEHDDRSIATVRRSHRPRSGATIP